MRDEKKQCFYCHVWYNTEEQARYCESSHDILMVPFIKEDLNRLMNFIATGDSGLLTERLSKTLFKHFKRGISD